MRGRKLVDTWVNGVKSYWTPEWGDSILKEVLQQMKEQIDRSISVRLEFFLRKNRYESVIDIDNMVKTVFDILGGELSQKRDHPISDDCWIDNIEATKIPTEGDEKTHIEIWEWNEAKAN